MKKIIISVALTFIILIGAVLLYIYSGSYNVSQLEPHNAITKWAISTTTHHSIDKRLKDIQVPPMNDSAMITEGFIHYNAMCATCHGGPGISPDELVKGLYPKPPEFYQSTDMPDTTEAFWIIKNGIKMTSMPAFGPTYTDAKIWAMTDFLLTKLNKMSPEEYQQWIQNYTKERTFSND